jgi:hypothetical protein
MKTSVIKSIQNNNNQDILANQYIGVLLQKDLNELYKCKRMMEKDN